MLMSMCTFLCEKMYKNVNSSDFDDVAILWDHKLFEKSMGSF